MRTIQILLPVIALVGWTLTILMLIPIRRFRAASQGLVTWADFALGESERVPPEALLPNRNYMNLLQLPMLFYVGCLVAYVTGLVDPVVVGLAWAYVVARIAHSLIHVSYNNVRHRFRVFALSNVLLVVLWVYLVIWLLRMGAS